MYLIKADDELDVQNLLDNAEFTHSDVRVSIPRFKVEYGAPLDEALQALGVRTAYEPEKADLTAMLDPPNCRPGSISWTRWYTKHTSQWMKKARKPRR